ncbi:MAG: hypothetical protein ACTSQS_18445 [Promethearchaeota archaeon]
MEKIVINCSSCDFEFVTTREYLPKFRIMNGESKHIDLINIPACLQCPKCWGMIDVAVIDGDKNEQIKRNR